MLYTLNIRWKYSHQFSPNWFEGRSISSCLFERNRFFGKKRFISQHSLLWTPYPMSNVSPIISPRPLPNNMIGWAPKVSVCLSLDFMVEPKFLFPEPFLQIWEQEIVYFLFYWPETLSRLLIIMSKRVSQRADSFLILTNTI